MKTFPHSRLAALLLAATAAALGAFAAADNTQPRPPPPHHGSGAHGARLDPERHLARLTAALDLTAEQQTKLRPLLVAQAEEMKKLDATALTGDQRRAKLHELRKADREKIAALLTPEQRQKFVALRAKGRHAPPDGQAGSPPPSPKNAE